MTDAETRVLARTAAVLVAVSAVRYGWEAGRAVPVPPPPRNDLPAMIEESRRMERENEARSRPLAPGERVDPNRASETELDRLPGVGPATARAVVRAREAEGAFRAPEDLLRVPGIGAATLERMRPHLAWGGSPAAASSRRVGRVPRAPPARPDPVRLDLNRATEADLEELPGVGPALARRIVEARAARGRFASVDDLLGVRGIGPATLERLRPRVVAGSR